MDVNCGFFKALYGESSTSKILVCVQKIRRLVSFKNTGFNPSPKNPTLVHLSCPHTNNNFFLLSFPQA